VVRLTEKIDMNEYQLFRDEHISEKFINGRFICLSFKYDPKLAQ
jgi:hypothetical protein